MGNWIVRAVKQVIFWTYERGTWQYDILCLLILGFIFLTPPALFDTDLFKGQKAREVIQEKKSEVSSSPEARQDYGLNRPNRLNNLKSLCPLCPLWFKL